MGDRGAAAAPVVRLRLGLLGWRGIDKLSAVVGRKQLTDEVGVDRSNLFQTVGAR